MNVIETPRLLLRPFTWDDFDFLYALNADPDVARLIGSGKPRSEAESREWMEKTLGWYENDNSGHMAVVLKETAELIGRCGLSGFEVEVRAPETTHPLRCYWGTGSAPDGIQTDRMLELGYTFAKTRWGHGYATEAACAVRDDAFTARGEDRLMSLIVPANTASKRVAKKAGLHMTDKVEVFENISDRFVLREPDWRSRTET